MLVRLDDYRWASAVATDLVNTAPEVMVSTGDGLGDPTALRRFLVEHDLQGSELERTPTAADLAAVHQLRRWLRELIETRDECDAVARASSLAAQAGTGPVLERDDAGRWQWHVASRADADLTEELALLTATGLLGVVRVLGHDRFRSCALASCNGVFVDTSRAGRRRYCEPEVCGSRVNAANYRARRRTAEPNPSNLAREPDRPS
jgi:predicted RNA-binding Zn ribbon-like protein